MPINKAFEAALKAISESQPEVQKSFAFQRTVGNLGKLRLLNPRIRTQSTEIDCGDHKVPVRIFFPEVIDLGEDKLIIFFHGGGWVTGNINSYNKVCANLAKKTGCKVASVDYRLAPEHRFPLGLEDCYAVAKHYFHNSQELFNIPPERITLMGDSAGGNLTAAVSQMARDKNEFYPTAQVLIYPATYNDHTANSPFESVRTNGTDFVLTSERIEEYMALYESKPEDKQSPYFAPLLAKDFSHQPTTLVVTAQYDPLRDEGEEYANKLKEGGNTVVLYRVMDALHGFISLPDVLPHVSRGYQAIAKFISEVYDN